MRWDDQVFSGTYEDWSWVVAREMIRELSALTRENHSGQRLCITAFDSGPIRPGPQEVRIGWTVIGDVMVSPPLSPQVEIPVGEYDEWYLFPELPSALELPDPYVNYLGFNLADPYAPAASQDPTWDRTNYDWLTPLQTQFWSDMKRVNPSSYISSGDADIVVSRNPAFAKCVLEAIREIKRK